MAKRPADTPNDSLWQASLAIRRQLAVAARSPRAALGIHRPVPIADTVLDQLGTNTAYHSIGSSCSVLYSDNRPDQHGQHLKGQRPSPWVELLP